MPKFPTVEAIHDEIDAWFADKVQQPPISYAVEAYNQAHTALSDLHQRMHLLITGEDMAPAATSAPDPAPETPPAAETPIAPEQPVPDPKAEKAAGSKE